VRIVAFPIRRGQPAAPAPASGSGRSGIRQQRGGINGYRLMSPHKEIEDNVDICQ
jgi:hypothetical protein